VSTEGTTPLPRTGIAIRAWAQKVRSEGRTHKTTFTAISQRKLSRVIKLFRAAPSQGWNKLVGLRNQMF
jgi:hypothetical protein